MSRDFEVTTGRRAFFTGLGAAALAASVPRFVAAAESTVAGAPFESVTVDSVEGRLRGQKMTSHCLFRGIRYAAPPLGANRFKAPVRLRSWKGVRDVLAWGNPALQVKGQTFGVAEPAPDEDCLFLNVWTPAVGDGRKRPVMFYCHGGGFSTGSGASVFQDGASLASNHDVVVVQSNHRLGIMGYLYLADVARSEFGDSANAGMLDIVEALAWVRRNIAAFGGDPDNVMVWGESGGGAKTSCIYAMPAANPYFHKASIESGPGVRMTDRETARRTTEWVLQQLGIGPRDLRRLREVPASRLLELQLNPPPGGSLRLYGGRNGIGASGVGGFSPVVDGVVLPSNPFDPVAPAISADKPLMVGSNRDEIVFFLRDQPDKSVFNLSEAGLQQRVKGIFGERADRLLNAYRRSRPDATPSQIAIAIESAGFAGAGSIAVVERKAMQGRAPVYHYVMTDPIGAPVPGTNYPMGAMHAMDIRLKFDTVPATEARQASRTKEELAEHLEAARNMSTLWARFARDSKPSAPGQPDWPAYDTVSRATYYIASRCHSALDPYPEERLAWM